jgi:hypothetical protein
MMSEPQGLFKTEFSNLSCTEWFAVSAFNADRPADEGIRSYCRARWSVYKISPSLDAGRRSER